MMKVQKFKVIEYYKENDKLKYYSSIEKIIKRWYTKVHIADAVANISNKEEKNE